MRNSLLILSLSFTATLLTAKASLPDPLFVTYWGSDSGEQSLRSYCQLGYFNVINIAFVDHFGYTPFNFATDGCDGSSSCTSLASDISYCQSKGTKILLSMGGATKFDCGDQGCTGEYGFKSEGDATSTAQRVWQGFFNGGKTAGGVNRPFGNVVLDGIDLDIEMTAKGDGQTPQQYYDTFVKALLAYDANIIIGAAPECQYGSIGSNPLEGAVVTAPIDFFFVQFFNNAKCSYRSNAFASTFQHWASIAASNPNGNTHVLIGLPGDTSAGSSLDPSYYVSPAETLQTISNLRAANPGAHVGVGVWNAHSSVGSSSSGSDPNWAQKISAGFASLPAAQGVSSVASSSASLSAGLSSTVVQSIASNSSVLSTSARISSTSRSGALAAAASEQPGTTSSSVAVPSGSRTAGAALSSSAPSLAIIAAFIAAGAVWAI